jgi:hypothetical protein
MNNFDFNMEQIIPVLVELKLAKEVTESIISILKNYRDYLYDFIKKGVNINFIDMEKIDKNSDFVIKQIQNEIYKQNPLKKIGSKKENIYEKLHRGLFYRYKLRDDYMAENCELLNIENINFLFECEKKSIKIGKNNYEIICFLKYGLGNFCENIDFIIKNININIINIQLIIMELNIILSSISTYIININNEVMNFELFDKKYLDIN